MIRPGNGIQVFLYADPVDMRKSIDGLSMLVEAPKLMEGQEALPCNKQLFEDKTADRTKEKKGAKETPVTEDAETLGKAAVAHSKHRTRMSRFGGHFEARSTTTQSAPTA